ncbi:DUF7483 domain-containing protein [Desulfovibrio caledoniensis]
MGLTPKEVRSVVGVYGVGIDYSAVFEGANLYRQNAATSNNKQYLIDMWFKRGRLGAQEMLFTASTATNIYTSLFLDSAGYLNFQEYAGSLRCNVITHAAYVDCTNWYHVQVVVDTTLPTASDRIKLRVNGEDVSAFAVETYYELDRTCVVNYENAYHHVGGFHAGTYPFSGYIAEFILLDGYTSLESGEFSSKVPGLWVPTAVAPAGYGTYGCRLSFSNAAVIGEDSSGNGNDHILAAGTAVQSVDTPTNNHATLNSLGVYPGAYSDGNTTWNGTYSNGGAKATIGVSSGKWYAEFSKDVDASQIVLGVSKHADRQYYPGYFADEYGWHSSSLGSFLQTNNTSTAWGTGYTSADRVRIALDMDIGAVWFGKNDTWENGATDAEIIAGDTTHAAGTWTPDGRVYFIAGGRGGTTCPIHFCFPETTWLHGAPGGFQPVCDVSRPEPVDYKPSEYFHESLIVAGTGEDNTVTVDWDAENTDWLIILRANGREASKWLDTKRGLNKYSLCPGTLSEYTATDPITVSGSTITIPDSMLLDGTTYQIFVFRASPESGFDIQLYTGDGVAGRTVAHDLAAKPIWFVCRSRSVSHSWITYTETTTATKFMYIDGATAAATNATAWNNTEPTDTEITLGTYTSVNHAGATFVAYLFAESWLYTLAEYVGNGSADGPYCDVGCPILTMFGVRSTATTAYWEVATPTANAENPVDLWWTTTETSAWYTTPNFVFTSRGIKLTTTSVYVNQDGAAHTGLIVKGNSKYNNAF